jgi:hypothetical protein
MVVGLDGFEYLNSRPMRCQMGSILNLGQKSNLLLVADFLTVAITQSSSRKPPTLKFC